MSSSRERLLLSKKIPEIESKFRVYYAPTEDDNMVFRKDPSDRRAAEYVANEIAELLRSYGVLSTLDDLHVTVLDALEYYRRYGRKI